MTPLYRVYVIELRAARGRSFYVGSTAHSVSKRLRQHDGTEKKGGHLYSGRLRPDLARGYGPYKTRDEAREAEKRIRRALERRGFSVQGACGRQDWRGCHI